MKHDSLHGGHVAAAVRHKKSGHLAERMERYLGIGMAVFGAALLTWALVAFSQTGSGPSWMQ